MMILFLPPSAARRLDIGARTCRIGGRHCEPRWLFCRGPEVTARDPKRKGSRGRLSVFSSMARQAGHNHQNASALTTP